MKITILGPVIICNDGAEDLRQCAEFRATISAMATTKSAGAVGPLFEEFDICTRMAEIDVLWQISNAIAFAIRMWLSSPHSQMEQMPAPGQQLIELSKKSGDG